MVAKVKSQETEGQIVVVAGKEFWGLGGRRGPPNGRWGRDVGETSRGRKGVWKGDPWGNGNHLAG